MGDTTICKHLPFRVNVPPEEFEYCLHEKLTDLDSVHIIRDDNYFIVVGYGETDEEAEADHDQNLHKLLERAHVVNLKLNSKKIIKI